MLPEPTDPPLTVTRLDRETLRAAVLLATGAAVLAAVALAVGARAPELATLAAVMTVVTLVAAGRGRDVDELLRGARPLPPGVRPARPRLPRPTRRVVVVVLAGAALVVVAAALGEGGGYAGVAVGVLGAGALRAAAEHRRVVARQDARGVVLLVAKPLGPGEPERAFVARA
jgi:hypothetical protein